MRNDLGGGPETFGLILAADGVGSVVASIVAQPARAAPPLPVGALRGVDGRDAPVHRLRPRRRTPGSSWRFAFLHGALITTGLVIWAALEQTRVPRDMRARVTSVDWFVSIGFAPISFALTGPAAAALGAEHDADHRRHRPGRRHRRHVRRPSGWAASSRRSPTPPDGEAMLAGAPATMIDELETTPGAAR